MSTEATNKPLTDIEKGQILALRGRMKHEDIGDELGRSKSTVTSFLDRLDKRGNVNNLPHPGAPRKTSKTADRRIVRAAMANTRVPLAELRKDIVSNVSQQTIRRRLREAGVRKWKALKRPMLTKEHARKRLTWAKAHRHWTRVQWEKICWSDESSIKQDSDPRRKWIWRHQTDQEKYAPQNVDPKAKHGGVSQMMWGCFIGNKLGPIALFKGMVNQHVYMDVLRENLLPFINALYEDGFTDFTFQQDGASPHTAKKTCEFLETAMKEHHFSLMEWPAISPDMNPIEHLWSHIKLELHRQYPDTWILKGPPEHVRRILQERIEKIWWKIGEEVLDKLVDSMPRRVHALLDAKGWYTNY